MIDTDEYFTEITDKSRGTIGYHCYRTHELMCKIIAQNKQLAQLLRENNKLAEFVNKKCAGEIYYELYERGEKLKKIEEYIKGIVCLDKANRVKDDILQIIKGKTNGKTDKR